MFWFFFLNQPDGVLCRTVKISRPRKLTNLKKKKKKIINNKNCTVLENHVVMLWCSSSCVVVSGYTHPVSVIRRQALKTRA